MSIWRGSARIPGAPCGSWPVFWRAASWTAIPGLRLCVLECGFGWLPFWVRRMDEQVSYVGRTAKLKHLPSEHFAAGRVFCNIEAHEHEPMFNMVTGALGDGVLMFGSDYPHYEVLVPPLDRQDPGVVEPRAGGPAQALLGERDALLQADLEYGDRLDLDQELGLRQCGDRDHVLAGIFLPKNSSRIAA